MKDLNTDPAYLFIFPAAYWVASKTVLYWISFPVCSVRYLIMHYNSSCWLQADKKALVSQSECVMWNKIKILVALRSLHTWRVFYAFNCIFPDHFHTWLHTRNIIKCEFIQIMLVELQYDGVCVCVCTWYSFNKWKPFLKLATTIMLRKSRREAQPSQLTCESLMCYVEDFQSIKHYAV